MNAEEREFTTALDNEDQMEAIEQTMKEKGTELLKAADEWIQENPYLAMGIALAAGVAIATLISKRD